MDNVSRDLDLYKRNRGIFKTLFKTKKVRIQMERIREEQEYIDEFETTKRELQNIQRLFEYASDPDLIDYAIYEENAIKMRISYIVKRAKQKNIRVLYTSEMAQGR